MESSNSAVDYMSAPVNPGDPKSLLKWKRPSVFGDFPEARSGASITVLGNQAIMFGGCTSEGPTNQMYTLKIGQTSFEWAIPKLRNDDPELSPPMPKPKPRWKHSATLFGNNCIFLFGGNLSGEQRLNDCWIFDSVTQLWSCPKYLHTQKDLPTPRSGHTATPVGEEYIYFFGGFGGSGFARRELSDLYCLDVRNLEKMHWKKILCKGKMPKSRSGHCATPTTQEKNHKIYVMGGWNCGEQFNDLWILDCTSNTWSEVDSNIGIPRWNMSACAVEAIPNWKIFIFGGSCGDLTKSENLLQGMYASDTSVMDTGDFNMFHPATTGEPPQGRSDASVAYDTKGSRLIIFGGWANKWFGDICTLDVGSIVGPPYAVLNIEPSMGPVTGGIKMTIIGVDFANRPPVTVRFATRKHFSDAEGEYIDEETMVCTTPSFEALGAQEVQVRVSLRGDSFTTTYRKFTFFNVTDCDNCVAFGPALINGAAAETQAIFHIQAVDTENEYRRSGGDIFNIVIEDPHGVTLAYDIRDNDDGDYIVIFQAGVAGKYNIEVEFDGTFRGNAGALRGSPFVVDFIRTHDTDTNRMDGQLVTDDLKKTISKLLTFSQSTLEGLKYEVQRGDIPALTDVKEHVMNVTGKQGELQIGVDTCAATISFLSKFELPWLREIVERLDKVQKLWKEAKTQSTKTAVRIAPLVKDASLTIKVDLAEYEATVAEYLDNHRHHEYWKSTTGFQKAQRLIEDARAEHKEQLQLFKKQLRIATVFEFPELLDHSKEMLNIVKNELKWQLQFWEFEESWKTRLRLMGMALWTELDGQGMQTSTEGMLKEIRSLPNEIKFCDAFEVLEKTIVEFTVACPLIKQLTHPAMRPRHWDNLSAKVDKPFTSPYKDKMCPVSQIINIGVHRYIGVIEDVTDRARKEEKIEQALVKMNEVWGDLEFGFKEYIDVESHKLKVCVISEEDFYALESDQMTIQGILASKFAAFFLKKLDQWKKSMEMMVTVIQLIRKTSKLWMFLEPLFQGSEEVQNELPMDAEVFNKLDADMKQVLKGAYMTKIVKQYCCSKSVQKKLEQIEKSLMECKLSLGRFMESKRGQFPRFYFMGELDLMHVLANGGQPPKLLTHIPKLFPTLQTLVLKEEEGVSASNEVGPQYRVIQFTSLVGEETLDLDPTVKMTGKPEAYLNEILLKIRSTLSTSLNLSLKRFGKKKRTEWLMDKKKVSGEKGHQKKSTRNKDSAQIVILVSALMFTTSVEKAFKGLSSGDKNALNSVLRLCHQQLSDMIIIVRNKISICDRFRVEAMIVKGAHYRDISHNLVQTNTVSPVSFQWSKQLRYKYSPESGAVVSILDASFNYGFEYVGNGARLVVTNLTNRVYLSMTQSMHSKMGCLSVGPSGSGKTSTTCDIAVAMAKPSFIFNFSPEFDYLSLTEIFKGVAASGTWACFDEFDRLPLNVLSVCSLQYKALLNAMRGDQKTVNIEGSQIRLQSTSAIFLNVNPSYRGRVELPDNLRILLRPITLYKPDSQIIYENLLMSSGFQSAKDLAGKLDIVMQMMKDLLAQERHYAWGLRVASNILMLASSVRRNNENMSENSVVMKSIKSICIPTLKTHDLDIFDRILSDIFPGEEPEESKDLDLENAIANAAMERDLWPEEYLLGRCSDLSDALDSSHTVLLMGGVGCGKTECWKSLARARKLKELNVQVINPKAVTVSELLGSIDNESREWGEGLLPKALRHLAGIRDEEPKWLIVDGEIDAGWAESLNALMDNSKTLILQSNERIHLKFYMRVIFEVNSLENTSPSTVGRSTIIWISLEEGAQWRSIFASWVQHQNVEQEAKDALANLVSIYVEPTVQYLESSKTLLPFSAVGSANTFLAMFSSMIKPDMLVGDVSAVTNSVEKTFIYCMVWSFGGYSGYQRGNNWDKKFSEFWKKYPDFDRVKFPARETVFDYWLNPGSNVFELWNRSPQFFSVPFDSVTTDISEVVVPVPETCPISFWGQKMISSNRGFLLIGPSGTGKSAILEDMCKKQDKNETMHIRLNCNYYSSTDNLKSPLEHILVKGGENRYAPPGGHDCVYFLDDLSLPQPDQYGTQSIHELLRQHIEYGYWYDTSKLEKKHIENVVYIGSVNPFAGSKSVGVRMQRHFTLLSLPILSGTSLTILFKTFLDAHLRRFNAECQSLSESIVTAAVEVHEAVVQNFRKTPINCHFGWSIRNMSHLFKGMLMSNQKEFGNFEKLIALWLHESDRAYGDMMQTSGDFWQYKSYVLKTAKKSFPQMAFEPFFNQAQTEPLCYFHYAESLDEQVYDSVLTWESLREQLSVAVEKHNKHEPKIDLILFNDAMSHITRITRILLQRQGHVCLIGHGCTGKQSLARIACHMNNMPIHALDSENATGLKERLKEMFVLAGAPDKQQVLLLTEEYLRNDDILLIISDLISTCEIQDLYPQDEKDAIITDVMAKAKTELRVLTIDNEMSWDWFIGKVKKNVKVILCMSPTTPDFSSRAKRFPSLLFCPTIDWFRSWPVSTLQEISQMFLAAPTEEKSIDDQVEGGEEGDDKKDDEPNYIAEFGEDKVKAAKVVEEFIPLVYSSSTEMVETYFENTQRHVYIAPLDYIDMLRRLRHGLKTKSAAVETDTERLKIGIDKLRRTKNDVGEIEDNMEFLEEAAEEKKKEAEDLAVKVSEQKSLVDFASLKCSQEQEICTNVQKDAHAKREMCEGELKKGEPALVRSQIAAETIDKRDLGVCKTLKDPPKGVDDVFAAIMVLFAGVHITDGVDSSGRIRDRSWKMCIKTLLPNINVFIEKLKGYQELLHDMKIPAINMKEVRQYIENEYFDVDLISSRNIAAGILVSWVINIVAYYDVYISTAPLREALAKATENLAEANKNLNNRTVELKDMQLVLNQLNKDFESAEEEKDDAVMKLTVGRTKLKLARRLARSLFDEEDIWLQKQKEIKNYGDYLVGDVTLASAFVSFVGPFDTKHRWTLLSQTWLPFLRNSQINISLNTVVNPAYALLSDEYEDKLISETLSNDRSSIENAIIARKSKRWPLLLDPQLQAVHWIKSRYESTKNTNASTGDEQPSSNILYLRIGMKAFVQILSGALEEGQIVLLEGVKEEFPPILMNLIKQRIHERGNTNYVVLGGSEFEMHGSFRLYMATRLSNPKFSDSILGACTFVDFTVNQECLEEQLLAVVIRKQRPDIAERFANNTIQRSTSKIQLAGLQSLILQKLADAEVDVCQDQEIVDILERAKIAAKSAKQKLSIVESTATQLEEIIEKYRPVAERGANIFMLLSDLHKINPNYVFSLNSFVITFARALDKSSSGNNSGGSRSLDKKKRVAGSELESTLRYIWGVDLLRAARLPTPQNVRNVFMPNATPGMLDDDEIEEQNIVMQDKVTSFVFNDVKRSIYNHDHTTLALLFFCKVMAISRKIHPKKLEHLLHSPSNPNPSEMGQISGWLSTEAWAKVCALNEFSEYRYISSHMQADSEEWFDWYFSAEPENEVIPGGEPYENLDYFDRILLIQALRPDRAKHMILACIESNLGPEYVKHTSFSMKKLYEKSRSCNPILFVLVPGQDPTAWVEAMSSQLDFTPSNGKFVVIALGGNNQDFMETEIRRLGKEGGWILLQNLHLVPETFLRLEEILESVTSQAHEDFRVLLSISTNESNTNTTPASVIEIGRILPESLLRECVQVCNDEPNELPHIMRSAWSVIPPERILEAEKPTEFKALSFALCSLHAILVGRKRYGSVGWSNNYRFNKRDLGTCINIMERYLDKQISIPWEELRYIFAELVYGGHMSNFWDLRITRNYLDKMFVAELFEQCDILPDFPSLDNASAEYEDYLEHIADNLPSVTNSSSFGIHENSGRNLLVDELGYICKNGMHIFGSEIIMQPHSKLIEKLQFDQNEAQTAGALSSTSDGNSNNVADNDGAPKRKPPVEEKISKSLQLLKDREKYVKEKIDVLIAKMPREFNMNDVNIAAEPVLMDDVNAPYARFAIQECLQMNIFLGKLKKSLDEIALALDNKINMTDELVEIIKTIFSKKVPHQWIQLSWKWKQSLTDWWDNVLARVDQLNVWVSEMERPVSIWLGGLFAPKKYLSAILQSAAKEQNHPIEAFTLETKVTVYSNIENINEHPDMGGSYAHDMYLIGASWEKPTSSDIESIGNSQYGGCLDDSITNTKFFRLPIMLIRPIRINPKWKRIEAGYLRNNDDIFECPVYLSNERVSEFQFIATMNTMDKHSKWIDNGTAILLTIDKAGEKEKD